MQSPNCNLHMHKNTMHSHHIQFAVCSDLRTMNGKTCYIILRGAESHAPMAHSQAPWNFNHLLPGDWNLRPVKAGFIQVEHPHLEPLQREQPNSIADAGRFLEAGAIRVSAILRPSFLAAYCPDVAPACSVSLRAGGSAAARCFTEAGEVCDSFAG